MIRGGAGDKPARRPGLGRAARPAAAAVVTAGILALLLVRRRDAAGSLAEALHRVAASDSRNSPLTAFGTRFYDAAVLAHSDKVSAPGKHPDHQFELLYQKYMWQLPRGAPLRVLEFNAGCSNLTRAPDGASIELWRTLFPAALISSIEPDEACAARFRGALEATGGAAYVGSQADPALVDSIVEASKKQGQFDLIIDDDKDRSPAGELAALHGLWPALRPGGVYVVESLPTSHQPGMSSSSGASGGIAPFIRQAIDDLECSSDTALVDPAWQAYCGRPEYVQGITRSFAAVECCTDACAIVKRRAPR
ncbi:hard-surface induced [Micractinium conductrix]|uniref:Hard-surface induced n=1 Tax=Micractinium conductrix TaxID=554055 RepID=A0A2P6V8U5_9CHLO|nr:hard-surface induced [Micractinium conductrix]|eukprot:PSC70508.1 hard-surface induced [Micractinium conductrix]